MMEDGGRMIGEITIPGRVLFSAPTQNKFRGKDLPDRSHAIPILWEEHDSSVGRSCLICGRQCQSAA